MEAFGDMDDSDDSEEIYDEDADDDYEGED